MGLRRIATGLLCALCLAGTNQARAEESADEKLPAMLQRASDVSVRLADPTLDSAEAKLIRKPLIRYSDQPRRITDASFWCWEFNERPVAFQKIEYYDRDDKNYRWFYCFASASPVRIEADWKVGQQWSADKPGIERKPLADEPVPNASKTRIRFQAKRIARRFSVRLEDLIAKTGEQLRLLDTPIHQYGSPTSDAMGAVFGFASNGTNPDALLLVELTHDKYQRLWKFGWVQMTTGQLTAKLDDEVVWTAPYQTPNARRPSVFDSWLFFYESAAGK